MIAGYLSREGGCSCRAAVVYNQDPNLLPRSVLNRTAKDFGPDHFKPFVAYKFAWKGEQDSESMKTWGDHYQEGWDGCDAEIDARERARHWVTSQGHHGHDVPLHTLSWIGVTSRVRDLVRRAPAHDR